MISRAILIDSPAVNAPFVGRRSGVLPNMCPRVNGPGYFPTCALFLCVCVETAPDWLSNVGLLSMAVASLVVQMRVLPRSAYPTLWNMISRAIFTDSPTVNAPICEWMYVMNVSELHRPMILMVLSALPLSLSAIAPPALKLWEDTRDCE